MQTMSRYELAAVKEIQRWKNPPQGWWSRSVEAVTKPLHKVADVAMDNRVGEVVAKALHGALSVVNDAAAWSVRDGAILAEFRDAGHAQVKAPADILGLDLEAVDKVVGYLGAKYKALALAEGAGAGALGLPGIAVDVPALLALNLRAVAEYASYYGVDVSTEGERLLTLQVLSVSSAPSQAARVAMMAEMNKVLVMVVKRKTWAELERSVVVKMIQELAKALGVRLTKAKLAQIIPAVGAAVGGGYNAWYTAQVVNDARMFYRARFLAAKYGEGALEAAQG